MWTFPSYQFVYVGNPIIIKCSSGLESQWKHFAVPVDHTVNGHLFIRKATFENEGDYYCKVPGQQLDIRSIVHVASKFIFGRLQYNILGNSLCKQKLDNSLHYINVYNPEESLNNRKQSVILLLLD